MRLRSWLWIAAFVTWLLLYLYFATGFGIVTLYVLVSSLGELQAWTNFGLWVGFAVVGGFVLTYLMKRAFEDRKSDASN